MAIETVGVSKQYGKSAEGDLRRDLSSSIKSTFAKRDL